MCYVVPRYGRRELFLWNFFNKSLKGTLNWELPVIQRPLRQCVKAEVEVGPSKSGLGFRRRDLIYRYEPLESSF